MIFFKRFLLIILLIFLLIFTLWLASIRTFSPITHYALIKNVYEVVHKLEQYESIEPIHDEDLEQFYSYIDLSEEQAMSIEVEGITVSRFKDGYRVKVPIGFDSYQYYLSPENCWYGSKIVIGLTECPTSSFLNRPGIVGDSTF